jgi:hypothetical protein
VDSIPLDLGFTCDCTLGPLQGSWSGDNCETRELTQILITSILGAVVAIFIMSGAGYKGYKHWLSKQPVDFMVQYNKMLASGEIHPDVGEGPKTPREIRRKDLHLIDTIGRGQFGEVWKAMLDEHFVRNTPEYMVAAKTVLDPAHNHEGTQELVAEATIMMQVNGHPHLVSIIGVITSGDPMVLILQFCERGYGARFLTGFCAL